MELRTSIRRREESSIEEEKHDWKIQRRCDDDDERARGWDSGAVCVTERGAVVFLTDLKGASDVKTLKSLAVSVMPAPGTWEFDSFPCSMGYTVVDSKLYGFGGNYLPHSRDIREMDNPFELLFSRDILVCDLKHVRDGEEIRVEKSEFRLKEAKPRPVVVPYKKEKIFIFTSGASGGFPPEFSAFSTCEVFYLSDNRVEILENPIQSKTSPDGDPFIFGHLAVESKLYIYAVGDQPESRSRLYCLDMDTLKWCTYENEDDDYVDERGVREEVEHGTAKLEEEILGHYPMAIPELSSFNDKYKGFQRIGPYYSISATPKLPSFNVNDNENQSSEVSKMTFIQSGSSCMWVPPSLTALSGSSMGTALDSQLEKRPSLLPFFDSPCPLLNTKEERGLEIFVSKPGVYKEVDEDLAKKMWPEKAIEPSKEGMAEEVQTQSWSCMVGSSSYSKETTFDFSCCGEKPSKETTFDWSSLLDQDKEMRIEMEEEEQRLRWVNCVGGDSDDEVSESEEEEDDDEPPYCAHYNSDSCPLPYASRLLKEVDSEEVERYFLSWVHNGKLFQLLRYDNAIHPCLSVKDLAGEVRLQSPFPDNGMSPFLKEEGVRMSQGLVVPVDKNRPDVFCLFLNCVETSSLLNFVKFCTFQLVADFNRLQYNFKILAQMDRSSDYIGPFNLWRAFTPDGYAIYNNGSSVIHRSLDW